MLFISCTLIYTNEVGVEDLMIMRRIILVVNSPADHSESSISALITMDKQLADRTDKSKM